MDIRIYANIFNMSKTLKYKIDKISSFKKVFIMSYQVVLVSKEELIPNNHIYRKFNSLWNFKVFEKKS
ncbi:MAG: hypothetical protein K1060chlam5_01049 [Candidatus Anoxychlamydiales bacterium]|nr:hypothetical protein [Candidatus Anoxychlamydiales bacterium]